MNAHQMERAAYIAAHRILTSDLSAPELACPGARRSATVDKIAAIIKSVYEAHNQHFDEATDWWPGEPIELPPPAALTRPALRAAGRATAVPAVRNFH